MGSDLREDLRFALRTMRRNPGFMAIAVLIIALGIGANTAIFSVVHALLIRPLPFHEPERLVWVANTGTSGSLSSVTLRTSNLRDWRRLNQSFEALTGYFAFYDYINYILSGEGDPEHIVGVGVAQDFLDVLGVHPELGRSFVDEECVYNGRPAVLLTHSFWRRRYGSDPSVVGTSISLNNTPTQVVGVLPPAFDFSSVFTPGSRIDFLTPFPISNETDRMGNTLAVIGRLGPGVTIPQAQADLDGINLRLREAEPNRWGLAAAVSGLQGQITGRFRTALLVLVSAVGLVLLIVCANLSSMLVARAASRRREIAVRRALGATRSRLVRQVLTESLLLALLGAALGIGLAHLATAAFAGLKAVSIPLLEGVTVDGAALLFTVTAAITTGLLFGLAPALHISGVRANDPLREAGRGASEGRSRKGLREVLVTAEVALACVLLVGAGLLLRSFMLLLEVDLGFQPEHATTWRVETNRSFADATERSAFLDQLVREVLALPGVESAGLTDTLPLGRNRAWSIAAKGEVYEPGQTPIAFPRIVDSGYLRVMRIPLVAGRHFTIDDDAGSERVIIVNETLARRLWPGQDPIDKIIVIGRPEWRVVGVVADVRHSTLEQSAGSEMYLPLTQRFDSFALDLVVRSGLPPESLATGVAAVLRGLDPTMPTGNWRSLTELVDLAVSPRRFILLLVGIFAQIALLLAALGLYGVVSYSVSQQSREIGIRMALGATGADIQRRIILRTLALAGSGIAVGLAGSLALTRLITSLLYGVKPTDPVTLGTIVAVLLGVSVLAGYLPARQASRIDPVSVLGASG
jgi:putative ABC transport system permease protein